jgi:hypothetical protein
MKSKVLTISLFCALLLVVMTSLVLSQGVVTVSGCTGEYAEYNGDYIQQRNYWGDLIPLLCHEDDLPFVYQGRVIICLPDAHMWYIGELGVIAGFWPGDVPFYHPDGTDLSQPPPSAGWQYVATGEFVEGMILSGWVTPWSPPSTNEAPVANAGADQNFDCAPAAGLDVTLDGSGSSDPDDDALSYTWKEGSTILGTEEMITVPLTPGTHTIILTVDDGNGETDIDEVVVTIDADTEAPDITVATEVLGMWPPNHKYQTFTLADFAVSVSDNCECADLEATIVCVTSDEPDDAKGGGDGKTTNDIVIVNDHTVKLRAERAGNGDGRVYTITISATDCAGLTGTTTCEVIVPHNKKGLPKNISSQFVGDDMVIPGDYQLSQNYPNPFNPTTEITFALPQAETVKLSIYNTNGQLIRTLVNGFYSEGFHTVMWNATDESGSRVTSGMYVYVLRSGEVILQNKMLLMK